MNIEQEARDLHTRIAELLTKSRAYVEGEHDEGCELHLEYGEQNFERANHTAMDEDDDAELRDWPDGAVCTCGTNDLLAQIDAALKEST